MTTITHNGTDYTVPDFIIGGGMKCATTSLHHMLCRHPDVYIPDRELKFFSIDDLIQQPEFFYPRQDRQWVSYDFEQCFDEYLEWYSAFFADTDAGKLVGEDTPTYLASESAARRILQLLPNVKLIFLLREPVARTYSHYWHWVRSGRAFYSFEDSVRYQAVPLLQRSFYAEQLRSYFSCFNASQIKIVLFENLVTDPESVFKEVLELLDLRKVQISDAIAVKNIGSIPRFPGLKLFHNRVMRRFIGHKHTNFLPGHEKAVTPKRWGYIDRIYRSINPMLPVRPRPMNTETHDFLTRLFVKKNAGLSKMVGRSLAPFWGKEFESI